MTTPVATDTRPNLLDLVIRAFRVFNGFNGPDTDELWWRTDDEYAPLTLFVKCSDMFAWGCADAEELTPENIGELERAMEDLRAIDPKRCDQADLLFCCRVRKMRPQRPVYESIDPAIRPLFDACGPERKD